MKIRSLGHHRRERFFFILPMGNYYRRKGLNSITIGVDVCKLHYSVGTCLRHVSNALINWRFCNHCCLHRNMPKASGIYPLNLQFSQQKSNKSPEKVKNRTEKQEKVSLLFKIRLFSMIFGDFRGRGGCVWW